MGHAMPPAAGVSPHRQRPEKACPAKESTQTALLKSYGHGQVADQPDAKQCGSQEQRPSQQDARHDDDSMEDPMDIFFSSHQRYMSPCAATSHRTSLRAWKSSVLIATCVLLHAEPPC